MLSAHDGGFGSAGGVVGRGAAATFAGDVVDDVLADFGTVVAALAPAVVFRAGTVVTGTRVLGTGVGEDGNVGTGWASASAADSVIGPVADFRKTAHVAVMAPPQMTRITSVTMIRFVVMSFVTAPSTGIQRQIEVVEDGPGPCASETERHSCCASDFARRQVSPGAAITRAPPLASPMLLHRR
jgi:hypothetical protein